MKAIFLAMLIILLTLIACGTNPGTSTTHSDEPSNTSKKISLEDAPDILDISLLLPERFEEIDPAIESMSNEDMGLGEDCSEVVVYLSEDPYQLIWGLMGIGTSRIEAAAFDRQMEDESVITNMIKEILIEGAIEEGVEITAPNVNISYPNIGDMAIYGEGELESMGFHVSYDVVSFRSNTVYVFLYSMTMSEDTVSLLSIAEEIDKRIGGYSQ